MKNTDYYSHHREHGGRVNIEIGDSKQDLFYPQVKISAWNNEANFSIRYTGMEAGNAVKENGKVKLKGHQEAHFYPKKIDLKEEYLAHRKEVDYAGDVEHSTEDFEHLKVNGHIIARDSQEERQIRQGVASKAHGKVLIVGLGLGVIQDYLEGATVIEINKDVIDFVKQNYPERYAKANIIHADFYDWQTDEKFDFIYGDIFTVLTPGHIADWKKFQTKAKTLLAKGGEIDGRIRRYAENWKNQDYSENGYEFEIIINSKPASNIFSFSVQSKKAIFYYQPHEVGEGEFRPDSVKGSYAVYHSEKQNNEYATGKIAHIYRPKIHDANGDWVYGDLDYNDGLMNVTVPQEFLDNATYPVTVDPTFGYTTAGASTVSNNNAITGYRTQGAFGTGTKISVYGGNAEAINQIAKMNVYAASSLFPIPNGETQQIGITPSAPNVWRDFNFKLAPTFNNTDYYPVIYSTTSKGGLSLNFDVGAPGYGIASGQAGFSALWPSSITPVTRNSNKYSIYVTYTADNSFRAPLNRPFKIAPSLGTLNSSQSSTQLVRTSSGVLYAVLVTSGAPGFLKVFKSTNNGVSWALQDYRTGSSTSVGGGGVTAAVIDNNDNIHIAYPNNGVGGINYLLYSTATDTYGLPELCFSTGNTNVAIAVDSNNIPHVIGSTRYSNRTGGVWSPAVTLTSQASFDIQIDQNNVPQISCYQSATGVVVLLGNKNNASSFSSTTIASLTTSTLGSTSLTIDPSGNTWVAYQAFRDSNVVLAKHIKTDAWSTWQTAISDNFRGKTISTANDQTDVYIFYETNAGGIAYDRYDTINGKWLGEQIIQANTSRSTTNKQYHNPTVKWSQYFNNGDTGANNTGQQTIEYLFDDGSTVYYDKLVTAQISTGLASISFSTPAGGATTTSTSSTSSSSTSSSTSTTVSTSTSSTSSSTSLSTSTSSTSTSTSRSTSTSSTSTSTSVSTSTSSTSSSTSISTSSTSQSTSTSVSTSTSSTSSSTSVSTSTSSTSSSISTSSTSQSTSTTVSATTTSTSSTSQSTSTSISTSTSSTSSSISTSSTSSSTSTSISTSTSSTSQSTSISTSISTSSTSQSTSTSSTSSSISTSSTSSSTSISTSTSSTSSSISTSSTSASTSLSTSISSTSSSISTSSTSSSTSTSVSTTSQSTSTSLSTSSTSTSTTVSFTTSTSSTSSSISTSSTSQSTSTSSTSSSTSTSTSTSSTSSSISTSSTSSSTSVSTSTSSTSSSISTSSTSSSISTSTSSTSQSTSTSLSTSSTSQSTSTSLSTSSTSLSTSLSTSSTSSSISTSSTSQSTSTSLSTSTSSTSTSTTISLTTSTSSTSSSISTSSTSSSTSLSTSSTSQSTSTSSTSTSRSTSTSSTSQSTSTSSTSQSTSISTSSTSTSLSTSTSSTSQSTSTSSTSTSISTSISTSSTSTSNSTSTSSTSQSTSLSTSISSTSSSTSTTVSTTTSTSSTSVSTSSTSTSTSTTTIAGIDISMIPRVTIHAEVRRMGIRQDDVRIKRIKLRLR